MTGVVALEASDLSTTSASLSSPKLCVINDEVRAAFGEACRVWPKPDPSAALPVFAELLTYVPLMEIMTDMAHMARFYGDTYAPPYPSGCKQSWPERQGARHAPRTHEVER